MIDLHIHTRASSDGQHSPKEIFEMAKELEFEAIAFADHNSVGSVEEGLRISREYGIEFIPCIELNTHYRGYDFHLLGYFIDHHDERLLQWLAGLEGKKRRQIQGRVRRLRELGFVLSAEEVLEVDSPLLFICPLSSRSDSIFDALHVTLPPRDGLKVKSYALVEHCRAISRSRLLSQRIAQLTEQELATILHRLQRLVGL